MSRIGIAFAAVCLALALAAAPAQAADAPAKKGENVVSKPQKARGAAKDENIKSPEIPLNDPSKAGQAAPEKKRGVCEVHVDNRTNLYIKIYVDGEFRGMIGPYGDGYALAVSGPTRLYARADYTDGTYSWWGPRTMSCPDGETITWTLQPG